MNIKKLNLYGTPILRIGMSLVFFWFAIAQLSDPTLWTGYIPEFLSANALTLVYVNAIFEIIAGLLLIIGIWTRWVALLLGLHMLGITISIGWTPTGIRDFGIAIATLSIFFTGPDILCLENKWKKNI